MPCAPGVVYLLCAKCVGAHLLMCFVVLRVPCLVFELSLHITCWCFYCLQAAYVLQKCPTLSLEI